MPGDASTQLTLLFTRPRDQVEEFARALDAAAPGKFHWLAAPLMRIEAAPVDVDLTGVGALAFTSANGVRQYAAKTTNRSLPAFCVGDMTAEAARAAGFCAQSADGDVNALAEMIAREHAPDDGAVLHVRGRHAAGDLTQALLAAGLDARPAEIYDQTPCALTVEANDALRGGEIDAVAFFSPRTADLFAKSATSDWRLDGTSAVSLSPAADAALGDMAFGSRLEAREPTRAAMVSLISAL